MKNSIKLSILVLYLITFIFGCQSFASLTRSVLAADPPKVDKKQEIVSGELLLKFKSSPSIKIKSFFGMIKSDMVSNKDIDFKTIDTASLPDSIKTISKTSSIKSIEKIKPGLPGNKTDSFFANTLKTIKSFFTKDSTDFNSASLTARQNKMKTLGLKVDENYEVYKVSLLASTSQDSSILNILKKTTDNIKPDEKKSIEILDSKIKDLQKILSKKSELEYAQPNYYLYALDSPNDPYLGDLWGLSKIKATDVWSTTTGSDNVLVASIDTGVDYTHEDLVTQIWINKNEINKYQSRIIDTNGNGQIDCQDLFNSINAFIKDGIDDDNNGFTDDYCGWDFANNDNDPMDDHFHGTHTMGTVGAIANNAKGVVGINWKVKILPVKFLAADGRGTTDGAIAALKYAANMGAVISNNSWGGKSQSPALEDAVAYEYSKGVTVVAAAGNNNEDTSTFTPGGFEKVITVAASDSTDTRAWFSNYGDKLDVAAPGVNIKSTVLKNGYAAYNGTSMATPHVSGAAALILSKYPNLINEQVRQLLRFTADDLGDPGKDIYYGYGRINLKKAFDYLAVNNNPLAPIILSPLQGKKVAAKNGSNIVVTGSILGSNFKQYTVEVKVDGIWKLIKTSNTQITNGELALLDSNLLKEDTAYDLRVTAIDNNNNKSEYIVKGFIVDNLNMDLSVNNSIYIGKYPIIGSASTNGTVKIKKYSLYWGEGENPSNWTTNNLLISGNTSNGTVLLGQWDNSTLADKHGSKYSIKLVVENNDGMVSEIKRSGTLDKYIDKNWPKLTDEPILFAFGNWQWWYVMPVRSTALADINNDGKKDVIYATGSSLYAYNLDGSFLPGFPYQNSDFVFRRPINVDDLDGDGKKEIIANVFGVTSMRTGVVVFNSNGSLYSTKWPRYYDEWAFGESDITPVVADINDDGKKELIFHTNAGEHFSRDYNLNVLDINGNDVSGYPIAGKLKNPYFHPADSLYDINADNKIDIAIQDGTNSFNLVNRTNGHIGASPYILDPGNMTSFVNPMAFGDIDGDKSPEIIALTQNRFGNTGTIYTFNKNIVLTQPPESKGVMTFKKDYFVNAPSVGDINNDGTDEVYFDSRTPSTPLADFDGDGKLEKIKFIDNDLNTLKVQILAENGVYWESIPIKKESTDFLDNYGETWLLPTVASVSDADKDGKMELSVVDGDNLLYVWTIPSGTGTAGADWPVYGHDSRRTFNSGNAISNSDDKTPPIIKITNIINDQLIFGKQKIVIEASDNLNLKEVGLNIVGTNIEFKSTQGPFEYEIDFDQLEDNKIYTIHAFAEDQSGNKNSDDKNIKISKITESEGVKIIYPQDGQTVVTGDPVSGDSVEVLKYAGTISTTSISISATNPYGTSYTQYCPYSAPCELTAPYTNTYKAAKLTEGKVQNFVITVSGVDGKIYKTPPITFTIARGSVDSEPPKILIKRPYNNEVVSNSLYHTSIDITDNVGVSTVTYSILGTNLQWTRSIPEWSVYLDLSSLLTGTNYTLKVEAEDLKANKSVATVNFKTSGEPPTGDDTIAPTINVISPVDNTNVEGNVNISATASDNVAVTSMDIYVDNIKMQNCSSGQCSYVWDTTNAYKGTHNIRIEAFDAKSNKGLSSITVNTELDIIPPTVTIISPVNNSTINNSINIIVDSSDNNGVTSVDIFVDGNKVKNCSISSCAYLWNTTTTSDGSHTITADAYDAKSNKGSASTTVNVSNYTFAKGILTDPVANSAVTFPITFKWSAGTSVQSYRLVLSTASSGADMFDSSLSSSLLTKTLAFSDVDKVPANGGPIYVRLRTYFNNGTFSDDLKTYYYNESSAPNLPGLITFPENNSSFFSSTSQVRWSAGSNVKEYRLMAGTRGDGDSNLFNQPYSPSVTSTSLVDMPVNGSRIFVTLRTTYNNNNFEDKYYLYYAYNQPTPTPTPVPTATPTIVPTVIPTPVPTPVPTATPTAIPTPVPTLVNGTPAILKIPTSTTKVPTSQLFQWQSGTSIKEYRLMIGTRGEGDSNIFNQTFSSSVIDTFVSGIPSTGQLIYVTLRSTYLNGNFEDMHYTFETKVVTTPTPTPTPTLTPTPSNCPNGVNSATVTLLKPINSIPVNTLIEVEASLSCRMGKVAIVYVKANGTNYSINYNRTDANGLTYYKESKKIPNPVPGTYPAQLVVIITDKNGNTVSDIVGTYNTLRTIYTPFSITFTSVKGASTVNTQIEPTFLRKFIINPLQALFNI